MYFPFKENITLTSVISSKNLPLVNPAATGDLFMTPIAWPQDMLTTSANHDEHIDNSSSVRVSLPSSDQLSSENLNVHVAPIVPTKRVIQRPASLKDFDCSNLPSILYFVTDSLCTSFSVFVDQDLAHLPKPYISSLYNVFAVF